MIRHTVDHGLYIGHGGYDNGWTLGPDLKNNIEIQLKKGMGSADHDEFQGVPPSGRGEDSDGVFSGSTYQQRFSDLSIHIQKRRRSRSGTQLMPIRSAENF